MDPKLMAYLEVLGVDKFPKNVTRTIDNAELEKKIKEGESTEQLEEPTPSTAVEEKYSRKVFVGGLPPDVIEEEIAAKFSEFGTVFIDWPHKMEIAGPSPSQGFAFLIYQEEKSVHNLMAACTVENNNYFINVSSQTIPDKPVHIRPWLLSDSDFILDPNSPLDPRKTIFVGGVPRPIKASELAAFMTNLFGGVTYAGLHIDPEFLYPKGAARVAFSTYTNFMKAVSSRFVTLETADYYKRLEIKPYVLDKQYCDECGGLRNNGNFAPFYCPNLKCLQYFCDYCWTTLHSSPGREFHKPLVKPNYKGPRTSSFCWT